MNDLLNCIIEKSKAEFVKQIDFHEEKNGLLIMSVVFNNDSDRFYPFYNAETKVIDKEERANDFLWVTLDESKKMSLYFYQDEQTDGYSDEQCFTLSINSCDDFIGVLKFVAKVAATDSPAIDEILKSEDDFIVALLKTAKRYSV